MLQSMTEADYLEKNLKGVDNLFSRAIDLTRCSSRSQMSNGTLLEYYEHILRFGLTLKSDDILSIGLALLVRHVVHSQAITTDTFTLDDLKERLLQLLENPVEQYQSYTLIVEDATFSVLEVEVLLRHAATHLLNGTANLDLDQIEQLVSAELKTSQLKSESDLQP